MQTESDFRMEVTCSLNLNIFCSQLQHTTFTREHTMSDSSLDIFILGSARDALLGVVLVVIQIHMCSSQIIFEYN